ncbi:FeoB-associated Cys-rich membrane protein [Faecalispora sporosphaeroides]|uniref:FeoB-associated Cys-rich membrane protein n=1 Tax=Faecalispora sporosphaeroides TaxID=1549 RepID=UPI00037D44BA|nr:FeoB-associated Cys-rich membrane protein [Faecalispora sporosphaeroides]
MATVIISIIVFGGIAFAAYQTYRTRKSGGCSGCSGSCGCCSPEEEQAHHHK